MVQALACCVSFAWTGSRAPAGVQKITARGLPAVAWPAFRFPARDEVQRRRVGKRWFRKRLLAAMRCTSRYRQTAAGLVPAAFVQARSRMDDRAGWCAVAAPQPSLMAGNAEIAQ
jgi:hypothetical protein